MGRPGPAPGYVAPHGTPGTPQVGAAPAAAPGAQAPAAFVPDAQYLAELAQRQFERSQQINAYNAETSNDKTNTAEAIRRLLARGNDDRGAIKNQANQQGLFYSGQLGKRLGDYQAEITRQRSDLTTAQSQREAAREAARQAILQGASIEDAAMLAAAADRQVQRDQADAAAGILAAAQGATPPGDSGGGGGEGGGGTAKSKGKSHHRRRRRGGHARQTGPNTAAGVGQV